MIPSRYTASMKHPIKPVPILRPATPGQRSTSHPPARSTSQATYQPTPRPQPKDPQLPLLKSPQSANPPYPLPSQPHPYPHPHAPLPTPQSPISPPTRTTLPPTLHPLPPPDKPPPPAQPHSSLAPRRCRPRCLGGGRLGLRCPRSG